jgi:hypothetical protein
MNIQKFATLENLLIVIGLGIIGYLIYTKYNKEGMSPFMPHAGSSRMGFPPTREPMHKEMMREHLDNTENPGSAASAPITLSGESTASIPAAAPVPNELLPTDLLPNYDEATKIKGNAVTDTLQAQNFIIGSFPQGLDTVATSKRIPYYDIRNNYPVPKEEYPWNNSPYDEAPGSGRRFFDIGA